MKKLLLAITFLASLDAQAQVYNKSALMSAAEYNDFYSVERLLQMGANVNATDSSGNTAYCYAYNQKNLNIIAKLQQAGADTNRKCNINGRIFSTSSVNVPYYNNQETVGIARRGATQSSGGLFSSMKPALYGGLGLATVAAVAGGGGGGGGSDAGFTPPANSTDVDPTAFETSEFYGNAASVGLPEALDSEFLDIINAQYAYARGYTGSGIKIAILDSGIDTDNPEFTGKLSGSDLIGSDLQSGDNDPNHGANIDHGTSVASIAAAAKDDTGMHGVAYDADLIGYRIGVDGNPESIDMQYVDEAINDGISKGATVFNMSFGISTKDNDGNHTIDATEANQDYLEGLYTGAYIAGLGVNPAMTTMINNAIASDSIMVIAAGNNGTSQSSVGTALPLYFTNLDGYFVNVVALNSAGNSIASYSNRCGITKDYCIAAPGSDVMLAKDGGTYALESGTSFAAPTVAGAVAVVQDAFGLSADRTLNILFQTATDMGAAGVDDVYGHGLLNLDLATAPGSELITSSLTGFTSFNNTAITTSGAMAGLIAPTFVIEDELYRTFKVNGNSLLTDKDENVDLQDREKTFAKEKQVVTKQLDNGLKTSFVMSNEQTTDAFEKFDYMSLAANVKGFDVAFGFTNNPGQSLENTVRAVNLIDENALANPYLGLAEQGFVVSTNYALNDDLTFQTNVFFGDIENSDNKQLGKSTSALTKLIYNLNDDSQISLESGFLQEQDTVLGSKFEGAFSVDDDNYTYFTGLNAKTALTEKLNLFANAYIGVTKAGTVANSLVKDISDIVSHSAAIGGEYNFTNKKSAGLILSQPLKVNSGNISYSYLSGGNIDKGYQYTNEKQSLAPSATQLDIQAFYKQEFEKGDKLNLGFMHSINADNIAGETDTSLLVKYRNKF